MDKQHVLVVLPGSVVVNGDHYTVVLFDVDHNIYGIVATVLLLLVVVVLSLIKETSYNSINLQKNVALVGY